MCIINYFDEPLYFLNEKKKENSVENFQEEREVYWASLFFDIQTNLFGV